MEYNHRDGRGLRSTAKTCPCGKSLAASIALRKIRIRLMWECVPTNVPRTCTGPNGDLTANTNVSGVNTHPSSSIEGVLKCSSAAKHSLLPKKAVNPRWSSSRLKNNEI